MGPGAKHLSHLLFLLLLMAASSAQAQRPDDRATQATDTRRQLIDQQRRATVCEVRSRRLEQQVLDLKEQLTATRDALARLVAQKAPPEPTAADVVVDTAQAPGSSIEVEELPDLAPAPPTVADPDGNAGTTATEIVHSEDANGRTAGSEAPAPLTPPSAEALTLYDEGYTLFHEQRYADAVTRFERYTTLYPNTELTDNALFWVGECHYALKDFEAALEAFTATVARYPDGNKVADALLKAGKSLMALGEQEEARRTFEEVVNRFPNAAAAATAAELLANQT